MDPKIAVELCKADSNNILPLAMRTTPLTTNKAGYVAKVEPSAIARLAIGLGAGRSHPSK